MTESKLTITRRFNATPGQVFQAWIDQSLMRQWLFTSPESESNHCECEPHPGGRWTITDRREGTDYTATGEYLVVEPPQRLVFTFAMPQFSPNSDQITVLCESDNGGCLMTFTQEGTDIAEELRQLPEGETGGSEFGWQDMFNNLTGVLVRSRGHGKKVTADTLRFERLLPGPIENVWSWLTDSDKRGQWFASGEMPKQAGEPFTIRFDHVSLSPHKVPTPDRFKPYEGGIDSNHTLTRYEPPHTFAITWGGGDEALSEVCFELFEEGEKVRLVLTHQRLEGPDQVGTAGGWHTHLAILEAKLAGITPPSFWMLFHGIEQDYQERLASR